MAPPASPQVRSAPAAPTATAGRDSYTFGDGDVAADRLRLLAEAYAASSRRFLRRLAREPARVAVDLGCGPGHTTALLRDAVGAAMTVGLDNSPRHLARARRQAPRGLRFVEHDVAHLPFPTPAADLLYGRFILTHLADPAAVLAGWAAATAPRGRLALEEVDTLAADDPTLSRYYALVEALQAAHGQRTTVGRDVAALVAGTPWQVERDERLPVPLPAATAARLHALNFATWRQHPFITATVAPAELDALGAELEALASGASVAPPVRWALAQVVLRRRP